MTKINIVVLNYKTGEVDVLNTKLNVDRDSLDTEHIEEYLERVGYKLKEVDFMFNTQPIRINEVD